MKAIYTMLWVLVLAAVIASCEQPPASLNFRTTLNGQGTGCTAMVYNDKGNQIMEIPSDLGGVGYINEIKPGTYTVKFKDTSGNMYPVVKEVTLVPGDQQTLEVDLGEAGPADAGGAATPDTSSSSGSE
jgi:hypothetical protein